MPVSTCEPCCNTAVLARSIHTYNPAVLGVLCQILEATTGGGGATGNVNLTGINGVAPSVGNGTSDTGTLRVTLASNSTGTVAATQSGVWNVGVTGSVTVTGTVAATQSGAWTVAATQSGTWNIGTVATITNPVTVTGTVAATQSGAWNVGITGTVPLPTGAATLAEQLVQSASLSVLDDWDETDRAKVNTIVGQAGVQGASGTVSANTQRVVLATDVALPTGTNTIGAVNLNPLATLGSGQTNVTTAGTQVALAASTAIKSVTIRAKLSNTGLIYVGPTGVTSSNGLILSPGDYLSLDIDNLADVFLNSSVNAEGVSYIYLV